MDFFFFFTQNSFPQVSEEFLYEWVTVVAFQVDIDWIRAMVASVPLHIGKILFIRNKKRTSDRSLLEMGSWVSMRF